MYTVCFKWSLEYLLQYPFRDKGRYHWTLPPNPTQNPRQEGVTKDWPVFRNRVAWMWVYWLQTVFSPADTVTVYGKNHQDKPRNPDAYRCIILEIPSILPLNRKWLISSSLLWWSVWQIQPASTCPLQGSGLEGLTQCGHLWHLWVLCCWLAVIYY